jgi:hypothetical protein
MIVVYDYLDELIVSLADCVNTVSAIMSNLFILIVQQIEGNCHDLLLISCIKKLMDYVMISSM